MEQELHNLLNRLYDAIPSQQEALRDFLSSEYEMIAVKSLQRDNGPNNTTNLFSPTALEATVRLNSISNNPPMRIDF